MGLRREQALWKNAHFTSSDEPGVALGDRRGCNDGYFQTGAVGIICAPRYGGSLRNGTAGPSWGGPGRCCSLWR
jgi:hypothetical protein